MKLWNIQNKLISQNALIKALNLFKKKFPTYEHKANKVGIKK